MLPWWWAQTGRPRVRVIACGHDRLAPIGQPAGCLQLDLLARDNCTRVAVVCHFAVIRALTGSAAANADCMECELAVSAAGGMPRLTFVQRHTCPHPEKSCGDRAAKHV